jgi:hypothetical protein
MKVFLQSFAMKLSFDSDFDKQYLQTMIELFQCGLYSNLEQATPKDSLHLYDL